MRVLVVEDDEPLADVIRRGLRAAGLTVDSADDGVVALEKATLVDYPVIVLDRDLPRLHGDEVCRRLRRDSHPARVLMLTASAAVAERVDGLELGAEDYLTKPFAMAELVARVRVLGRRPPPTLPEPLRWADVELDPARRVVRRGGRVLSLTRKEFGLLETLLAARGAVVSAEELLESVWDDNADPFTNAVRITVMTLRRKLGSPPLVETVTGVGYRMAP
ncbi:response regulator transcription factor [Parafrankia elaeagni]|uniref:response regulator transcription factor n=1 Tax=Parafrankia elaeagni TaxID=222534 RepID=UPI00035F6DB5|nr:response regulator transcription factor [Parafrankia elaeagni]